MRLCQDQPEPKRFQEFRELILPPTLRFRRHRRQFVLQLAQIV
ncbi:MAG: hypothetical protein ACLSFJ_02945 [Holdemania filiformis]